MLIFSKDRISGITVYGSCGYSVVAVSQRHSPLHQHDGPIPLL